MTYPRLRVFIAFSRTHKLFFLYLNIIIGNLIIFSVINIKAILIAIFYLASTPIFRIRSSCIS